MSSVAVKLMELVDAVPLPVVIVVPLLPDMVPPNLAPAKSRLPVIETVVCAKADTLAIAARATRVAHLPAAASC